ncbi:MAG TPA: DUF2846 domain-containing protein [Phnomibacter sp.]|nr:DUF2846 domain-containing protein [Phnomibacter sp.]
MKHIVAFLLFLSLSSAGLSQSGTAKVYLLREGAHEGSAVSCSIFKDEELLCKLNNKRYSVHDLAPGSYTFHAQWSGNKLNKDKRGDIVITLEGGKTYYIKFNPVAKAFNGYVGLIDVTENTFQKIEPMLKLDDKCF